VWCVAFQNVRLQHTHSVSPKLQTCKPKPTDCWPLGKIDLHNSPRVEDRRHSWWARLHANAHPPVM
jgi:hypothetical protein